MLIEKGTIYDIDELEVLYDDLNDYLETNSNYPGWIKGVYPVRETAATGIESNNLFVLKIDGVIAGSVILNHKPENAYNEVSWDMEADYKDVIVVHTLVVNPKFMRQQIAWKLMQFAQQYAIEHGIKSIRLDVSIHNIPAIALYEKLGYKYISTVDLGLNYDHLKWFKLYEKLL